MTKRQGEMMRAHARSTNRTIWDAYERPSRKKERAYEECYAEMIRLGGYDGRVVGANSNFFSYAFFYRDKEGKARMKYMTHANDYDFSAES